MDEKYKVTDVACNNSEEDEGSVVVGIFSVIMRLGDPYQDWLLPYVIGSDKKIVPNNIGSNSSSSESKQTEERKKSESEKKRKVK